MKSQMSSPFTSAVPCSWFYCEYLLVPKTLNNHPLAGDTWIATRFAIEITLAIVDKNFVAGCDRSNSVGIKSCGIWDDNTLNAKML